MPDLIRHPDVVPTKVGNYLKYWIPAEVYPVLDTGTGMTTSYENHNL